MALDYLCANAKSSKQGVGPLKKETKVTQVTFKNEIIFFFVSDVTHSRASTGPNCLIWRLCHSPIQCVCMTRLDLADKFY